MSDLFEAMAISTCLMLAALGASHHAAMPAGHIGAAIENAVRSLSWADAWLDELCAEGGMTDRECRGQAADAPERHVPAANPLPPPSLHRT
jgi:hypothetical protein